MFLIFNFFLKDDDDFVMSDEEFEFDGAASDNEEKNADSDFVADEVDSGSDWEGNARKKGGRVRNSFTTDFVLLVLSSDY